MSPPSHCMRFRTPSWLLFALRIDPQWSVVSARVSPLLPPERVLLWAMTSYEGQTEWSIRPGWMAGWLANCLPGVKTSSPLLLRPWFSRQQPDGLRAPSLWKKMSACSLRLLQSSVQGPAVPDNWK